MKLIPSLARLIDLTFLRRCSVRHRRRFSLPMACALVAFASSEGLAEITATAVVTPTPSAILNYSVGRLASDPLRPRVYATVPDANVVIVVDTASLKVIKTIAIGSAPQGLAVSADGSKLW